MFLRANVGNVLHAGKEYSKHMHACFRMMIILYDESTLNVQVLYHNHIMCGDALLLGHDMAC